MKVAPDPTCVEAAWTISTYAYDQHRRIDTHTPTPNQLNDLQTRFQEYYPEYHVDLEEGVEPVEYTWVTGFKLRGSPFTTFKTGDNVAVQFEERGYVQLQECLQIKVGGHTFYFAFIFWYHTLGRSRYNRDSIWGGTLEKWSGNSRRVLPITPRVFAKHVMIQHFCVRACTGMCGRSSVTCNCKRCFPRPFCWEHDSYGCSGCDTIELRDVHHNGINEFYLVDSEHGFR